MLLPSLADLVFFLYHNFIMLPRFVSAVAVAALAWQPPQAIGFSLGPRGGDRLSDTITVAYASPQENEDEKNDNNTKSQENGITIADTAADATMDNTRAISTEDFSVFAEKQTPLLAELLAQKNDETDSLVMAPTSEATSASSQESTSQLTMPWMERSSEIVVVALATIALVGFLGDLLSDYEFVQNLRYFWPLSLGVYYGLLLNQANPQDSALRTARRKEFGLTTAFSPTATKDDPASLLLQIGYVFGGFGLFVGGLADAVLPVWMTGPNWITNAGLAPDCAILLLGLSVGDEYNLFGTKGNESTRGTSESLTNSTTATNDTMNGMTPLLLRITLWAELYKLGEGSLDEVFSNLKVLLSASV